MNSSVLVVSTTPTRLDRVRRNTAPELNQRIDRQIERNIRFFSTQPPEAIAQRLRELEGEWDVERVLEVNAAALAFSGVALSLCRARGWLALSATVMGFLFLHGIQGWCPPLPALRRLGVRTREEIDRERFALCHFHREGNQAGASGAKVEAEAAAPTGK